MPDQLTFGDKTPSMGDVRMRRGNGFLFYAALLIFLLMLASYGGLIFLNRAQQDAEKELLAQIDQKREELRPELVQQIFAVEQRFRTIQALIQKHALPSKTFTWIEQHTHPRVAFASYNFDNASRKLTLPGRTDSLVSLNQQIVIFQEAPEIEKVDFGGLAFDRDKGIVTFSATVIIKPSFLQVAP